MKKKFARCSICQLSLSTKLSPQLSRSTYCTHSSKIVRALSTRPRRKFLQFARDSTAYPRWNSQPPSRGIATTGSRFAEVGRAWKILTPVRGTILFCGWNARYVRERGGSAHRLAVGLWSWGWLGPIIGRGGARAGFWGCGGTLRFEGWSAISRGRLSYRPSIGSPRPRGSTTKKSTKMSIRFSRWFVSLYYAPI